MIHQAFELVKNTYIFEIFLVIFVKRVGFKFDIFQSLSKLDDAINISIFQRDNMVLHRQATSEI
jgi:ABC-type phosphate/phosphonate transport system ATPase subunit